MGRSRSAPLSEVAAPKGLIGGPFGSSLGKKDYVEVGVPVVRGQNLSGPGRFNAEGFVFVSEAKATTELARNQAEPGDVVFTQRGTLGQVGLVPSNFSTYIISQSQMRLRVDPQKADARYIYYCFRDPLMLSLIESRAIVTGVPHINLGILADLPVPLRDVGEQRGIAEVLGALDDKIDANGRLVPLLRDLAKALLRRAADPATSYVVGEVADVRKGLSYTGAGLADAGMPMVNLANAENFGWLKRSGFKHYTGPYKPRHVAPPGALLVSGVEQTWRHDIIGWPMLLPDDVGPALFSHHVFVVDFRPEWEWLRLPLWAHLYAPAARARLEGIVYGTTVATLPVEALTGLEFPAPAAGAPALETAADLLHRAWAAEHESTTLARLRDTLLPPLLSGHLRVRDAEALVSDTL